MTREQERHIAMAESHLKAIKQYVHETRDGQHATLAVLTWIRQAAEAAEREIAFAKRAEERLKL